MRPLLAAVAAAATILAGAFGVPAASAATARACAHECVTGNWNFGASPPWFEARWTANDGSWYERGFIHCQNGRSYETSTGGWVVSLNLNSRAHCSAGYAGVGGGFDWKTCSSCSFTRHWITGRLET